MPFVRYTPADVPCFLSLQNPAIADIYTEHAHQVTVAKYAPSGFYIASGGKPPTYIRQLMCAYTVVSYHSNVYPLIKSIVFKPYRCIRKDPYLGHYPEGASAQVRVHPYFRQGQGHCMDRGQQEDCCCR